MKNIKIFAFLAVFLLSAFVSTAWAEDVTLTYKISVRGAIPHAYITNADGKTVCDWGNGIGTLWPANEGHTMNDDYKITFKPNQELDKTGKNENDGTPSTTAFRTEKNTIFTVSVGKGFYFKSVTFKEDGTEKASSSNIAPNSTSIRVEVPENKFFNYITVVLTTDIHYSLIKYDENLTVSPSPSMTYNNIPYYAAGQTVTFGFSGSGSVEYFVNGVRIEGNSVIVGRQNLKVQIGVSYIDENGKPQILELGKYTVLTSLTDVSNLGGGWYVVQGEVSYGNSVNFGGDAHLILADGAEMEIVTEGEYGIYASNDLTIYGQNEQRGILNDTAKGTNGSGIYSSEGNITIIGGKVTATGKYYGIYSSSEVTINGGSVTATGSSYGIYGYNGVTISGGSVTATGSSYGIYGGYGVTISGGKVTATGNGDGIRSYDGNIILGWTNSTDFIKGSYYSIAGSVSIAEGKSFKDEDGKAYSGTIDDVSDIAGKKLEPCYAVTFDAQNGDDPIMLPATFDENGVAHVEKPNDPIRSGFTFEGWFTATDGNAEFDFTKAVTENTTAYAHWNENTPVEYIDEKGETKKTKNYILLTNDINVDNLPGGWYVVEGEVEYTNQVKFSGDAHLILADGAKLEIVTEGKGIEAAENLTIYGQSKQSDKCGTLAVTSTGGNDGIYSSKGNITINGGTVTATSTNGYGIYSYSGDITINGGKVTATSTNGSGIYGRKGVTISGGTVTATSKSGFGINSSNGVTISGGSVKATSTGDYGIYSSSGKITISGGTVTATGNRDGIRSYNGNIILGWTNSTDFIKASSYYSKAGSVQIAEGKSFKDENGIVYSGTLNSDQLSAIEGKTLEPCYAVTFDAQNGDDPIMLLTTFDENGVAHVAKPADPTRDGFSFEGWFTAKDGNTEFDFTKAVTENTTAYAHWNENTPVKYIDENGGTNETKNYILLTNDINVDNLPGGWYVVEGEVKYTNQVKFEGEAHLILADGAKMVIKSEGQSEHGIYASNDLTIYGQSDQSGTLNVTALDEISGTSSSSTGVFSDGNITINGGSVTASGSCRGIYGSKGVTINGGSVTATGSSFGYGIYGYNGVTISGGSVTATSDNNGIYSREGNITLSWTNSTDNIKASSYYSKKGSVQIAEGKSFKDENGIVYSGTLTGEQLSAIKGKTLTPVSVKYIDENGEEKSVADYTELTSTTDVSNLPGGWYVVQGEVSYTTQVKFSEDAYLILADGAKLEIEIKSYSTGGIRALGNLTIYGQSGQIGILNVSAKGTALGINGDKEVTISGGNVIATSVNCNSISATKGVTISGGSVTATGYNAGIGGSSVTISGGNVIATSENSDGIDGYNGVTISGGSVTATGETNGINGYKGVTISGGIVTASGKNYGIYANSGNISLSWTNSTDAVKASNYYSEKGSVVVADGKSFKDDKGRVYSGTLSDNQIAAISHQTIEPLPWKNLGDYAAVQIFEDENGKKHAVIDGEYEGTETVDIPNEIAVDAVDYIRNFDANTPSTVLMPVRLPSCATVNAKFYKLDEVYQSGYRWVAKVQNIGKDLPQANTAYAVMLPTAGKLEFNFEGCATAEKKQAIVQTGEIQTSGNTDGSWYFTGTYAFKRWTETENKDEVGLVYGFAGSNEDGIAKGQFGRVDFGAHANPLRCYLRKKDDSVVLKAQTLAKAAPQVLKAAPYSISLLPETIDVEFVDDDENGEHTTAIGRMDTRTGKIRLLRTDRTYDLKGRRVNDVNRAAKGAYYGKKF